MRKSLLLLVAVLIGAMLVSVDADAQKKYKKMKRRGKSMSRYKGKRRGAGSARFRRYSWVGGGINAGNYFGDLAPVNKAASTDVAFTRPGFGAVYGVRFHPQSALRASINWVRLKGSDFSADPSGEAYAAQRYTRNLSFRNDILEISGGFEMDLLPNKGSARTRVPFTPYLFLGAAVFLHSPKGKVPEFDTHHVGYNPTDPENSSAEARFSNAGKWVSLRKLGTEGQNLDPAKKLYSNVQFSIPIVVGFRMRLPGQFDAAIEFGYRHLFFDYLDDVSGNYADLADFPDTEEGRLARAFSDRSIEHRDVNSEELRDLTVADGVGGLYLENDIRYRASYGKPGDIRGGRNDNDQFFVTQIRLTYLLNAAKVKAKFR